MSPALLRLISQGFTVKIRPEGATTLYVTARRAGDDREAFCEVYWTDAMALTNRLEDALENVRRAYYCAPDVPAPKKVERCRGCSLEEGACVCMRGFQ